MALRFSPLCGSYRLVRAVCSFDMVTCLVTEALGLFLPFSRGSATTSVPIRILPRIIQRLPGGSMEDLKSKGSAPLPKPGALNLASASDLISPVL